MSAAPEVDELAIRLGDLAIRITRVPERRTSVGAPPGLEPAVSESSFTIVSESPSQGALARSSGSTEPPAFSAGVGRQVTVPQ